MKKEGLATSRATSANFSITEIEIRSNLGSAFSNNSRKLSDNDIINVKRINEKKKTEKLDKQNQRPAIELEEYSNKIENLSVSVISSNETLIRSSAQTNKTVRPQCDNHSEIAAESQKEKEKLSKYWIVPGFGFIAVMVLLIGIILGFLGAFGGNSLVNFENSNLYI